MERHEAAIAGRHWEAGLPLTVLSQLLKSCLRLEVDATPLADRLQLLLGAARWRHRAHAALHSGPALAGGLLPPLAHYYCYHCCWQ